MSTDSFVDFAPTTSTGLIHGMTSDDPESWERFVRRYSGVIYSMCRTHGVSPDDSADILQIVCLKVDQSIASFQRDGGGKEFRRWLRTVTHNAIVDHFRSKQKHQQAVDIARLLEELRTNKSFCNEESDSAGPVSQLTPSAIVRQTLTVVRGNYEEPTWRAFWRTAVDGQSAVDVAKELGTSDSNVRQAKCKILKHLRQELTARLGLK
ncbi:MAG TPA: sigma-70 family RNA polymerase sigma factor [Planctomycetaceae bacterium]|nr:sigma-70 family RNA polymerase sigma factor [Planctomycetaceae bacterium]HQZ65707.1 sigma-70 family RNA polymerase sigma factor [Planctomycetaceae bacterium]